MSVTTTIKKSLWDAALLTLSDKDKEYLNLSSSNQCYVMDDILKAVKERQQLCMDKRWKLAWRGGRQIILRDQFEKVAKWAQKFKEVGDIAVQYDTSAASLPWAAVRLLLQISINDVEAFTIVAEGIEAVSRVISRCAIYEAAYFDPKIRPTPQEQLQKGLTAVYSAILKYLAKAIAYYARGSSKRILSSALDSTGGTRERLEKVKNCEEELQKSVGWLMQGDWIQTLRRERKQQYKALESLFHSHNEPLRQVSTVLARIQHNFAGEQEKTLYEWLSTLNHRERHRQIHCNVLPGTGQWLSKKRDYQTWNNSNSSCLLWIKGIPGCGKTKLLSIVVERALNTLGSNPAMGTVAFFYCSRNDLSPADSSPDAIFRSIVKQMAYNREDGQIHPVVQNEFQKRKVVAGKEGMDVLAPNVKDCTEMMLSILADRSGTIIIDGIDEMEGDPGEILLPLKELSDHSASPLKILVSSRGKSNISSHLCGVPRIEISESDNSPDIALYIETSLNIAINGRRLLQGDVSADLRNTITTRLTQSASSMFLWVSLHLEQLCDQERFKLERDVIEALDTLPPTLQSVLCQIYGQIERYPREAKNLAERVFGWLLVAERPLTSVELLNALSSGSTLRHCQPLKVETILNLCAGFVVKDPRTDQLGFMHTSIREYLQNLPQYSPSRLNRLATIQCIDFLLNGSEVVDAVEFGSDIRNSDSFHSYSTLYWPRHLGQVHPDDWNEEIDRQITAFVNENERQHFQMWMDDVNELLNSSKDLSTALVTELDMSMCNEASSLFVASVYGVPRLLIKTCAGWDMKNDRGVTAMYVGSRMGHVEIVKHLITLGACIDAIGGRLGTPLQAGAFGGHDAIVQLLITAGANPWKAALYECAIDAAIAGARQLTAVLLLSKYVQDVKAKPEEWLRKSVQNGLQDVVLWLLEYFQRGGSGEGCLVRQNPLDFLQRAIYQGRTRLARKLLKDFPDINASGGLFGNALQAACIGGHLIFVKQLLDLGADPNSIGRYGTPLRAACMFGKIEVIELLLQRGALIGIDENELEAAASAGSIDSVQLLLTHCIIPDSQISKGLYAAARGGHCDIVQYFLKNGGIQFASDAHEIALAYQNHDVANIIDKYRDPPVECARADMSRQFCIASNYEDS